MNFGWNFGQSQHFSATILISISLYQMVIYAIFIQILVQLWNQGVKAFLLIRVFSLFQTRLFPKHVKSLPLPRTGKVRLLAKASGPQGEHKPQPPVGEPWSQPIVLPVKISFFILRMNELLIRCDEGVFQTISNKSSIDCRQL